MTNEVASIERGPTAGHAARRTLDRPRQRAVRRCLGGRIELAVPLTGPCQHWGAAKWSERAIGDV